MLKDQDADSAYSGEGSNTDSGRGASEEGENMHNTLPHNVTGKMNETLYFSKLWKIEYV